MPNANGLNKCLTAFDQDSTLVAVVEMSQSSWLVAGIVPGVERQPLKKLKAEEQALFELLHRWRDEALKAGRKVTRITVAYEAGRDGFWLARWLRLGALRRMSSIHRAWQSRESTVGPRPIDSIPGCSNALSSAGCAVKPTIAAWQRSRPSTRRMPSARTGSTKVW